MSLADDILNCNDSTIEPCPVKEWGEAGKQLHLRLMTGAQRDAWETQCYLRRQSGDELFYENMKARFLALCLCDDKGELVFRPDQVEALGKKSGAVLARIWKKALALNKLGKDDVDELVKN